MLKRILWQGIFTFFLFNIFATGVLFAQNTNNFEITNFEADYYLTKDQNDVSQLKIVEKITAKFPEYNQNHGILRAIPQKYLDKSLHLKIASVTDASFKSISYSTYDENDNLVLKIGNKDVYVHGLQTYVITYSQDNVIKFFDDHDELYWNVNGVQWPQPIDKLSARLHLSSGLAKQMQKDKLCFTGYQGSKKSDCLITETTTPNETVVTIDVPNGLLPYQTTTFVIGFIKGTFSPSKLTFWESYGGAILLVGSVLLIISIPLIVFMVMLKKWHKYGKDPKGRGTIIAQYEPPKGSSLLINDFVLHEKARTTANSAQLINLAIRKYVLIIDASKDAANAKDHNFSLQLIKPVDGLSHEEIDLLKMFFGDDLTPQKVIKISDLKYKLGKQTVALSNSIAELSTVNGYFARNPSKIKRSYIGWGVACIVFAFIGIFTYILIPLSISLAITSIILFIGAKIMPARTMPGVELNDYLLGLKLYIGMAEQDRIRFHQSPDNAERHRINLKDNRQMVKLFESLLPYAILFGMEKEWGKQFENIYTTPPDWYNGNWTAFNAGYLAGSLNSFSTSNASSFSSPSSSSGSGFSGSGGFSGGGGGGGGGGGW